MLVQAESTFKSL